MANIQVAEDYEKYRASWQSMNQLLAANPDSALTAGWVITLQRANELGLDNFEPSDFYGGLQGFVTSFGVGSSGSSPHYEDFSLGWDGSSLTVADSANPSLDVFDLPQAGGNGSFVPVGNFLAVMGYNGQWPGGVSSGNDFAIAAGFGTGVSIDSWNTSTQGGNDIFVGTSYNDWIALGTGYSWADGGAGDDYLAAPGGTDVLLGGAGNDTIEVGAAGYGAYYLSGGSGNDRLVAHAGTATFVGGSGDDTMVGGSGSNTFIIDPGLTGGSSITGGSGTNTISFERITASIYLDLRNDDLTNPSWSASQTSSDTFTVYGDTVSNIQNITGGSGNDWICNTQGMNSVINGGPGDDTLHGWGGNDTIEGGPGADSMNGWGGVNTLTYEGSSAGVYVNLATGEAYGGDADGDTFTSFQNLTGSAYNDELVGIAGSVLNGLAGDDTLDYSGANVQFLGGDGNDTVNYSAAPSAVTVNLQSGATGGAAAGNTYNSVEDIVGTAFNDSLTALSTGSTLDGGAGNDLLYGGNGSDTFVLGQGYGSDFISDNNQASNTLQLGPGVTYDTLSFGAAGGTGGFLQVAISGTSASAYIGGDFAAASNDVIKNIDINGVSPLYVGQTSYMIGGGNNADTLKGLNNQYNFIDGYAGADTIYASGAAGVISSAGSIIIGGPGNDVIYASGAGDQYVFERGDGNDIVYNPAGANTIVFGPTVSASDVIYSVDGGGNLYIGLQNPANTAQTAAQVPDSIEFVGGGIETITFNTQTGNTTTTFHGAYSVEAGGTTVNLSQLNIPWLVQNVRYTPPGGGGGHPLAVTPTSVDPIVLDLSGDGLELSSVNSSGIATTDLNGTVAKMGWIGPTDGILVTDRNGDGQYNTLSDLDFAQDKAGATSDLSGLAAWDTNGDGVVNASDANWSKLKIWVDANQDGIAEPGEIETMAQAGITSINLKSTPSGLDPAATSDSYLVSTASFTRADGSTASAYEVALARELVSTTASSAGASQNWGQVTDQATLGLLPSTTSALVKRTLTSTTAGSAQNVQKTTSSGDPAISSQAASLWSSVLDPATDAQDKAEANGSWSASAFTGLPASSALAIAAEYADSGAAASKQRNLEPIVIDFSGAGPTLIDPSQSSVSGNFGHTGTSETVGWVGASGGILAYSASGDGQIDPTSDITFRPDFPDATTSIQGLRAFDTNGDGVINAHDASFANFLIWGDKNSNGVADAGETETLSQAGITQISLTPTGAGHDDGNLSANEELGEIQVTMADGTTRTAYDLGLGVLGASQGPAGASGSASNMAAASPPPVPSEALAHSTSASTAQPGIASALTGALATSSSSPLSVSPSVAQARGAEDGPESAQGAALAPAGGLEGLSGWWGANAGLSASILDDGVLSSFASSPKSFGQFAKMSSTMPDAATMQRQLLLTQSMASFQSGSSGSSAVWARQPQTDAIATLVAAASTAKPPTTQAAAVPLGA
jgi:Ca2+-binding RTX toxin-like protein